MAAHHPLERGTLALPCPECRARATLSGTRDRYPDAEHRIGNARTRCQLCNAFAQNVMRLTRKRLKEMYAEEYERIRVRAEMDLYPQVIEEWSMRQGLGADA